uniref:BAR domain-containing protein n=1 Tax=Meleagris gallopavo TaxID=9103 RepID=A0A803YG68_MELGA
MFSFFFKLQKVSEKVGGAEGTKLDDDFKEMERKVDVTSRAVMEIMAKTIEYLQPNPGNIILQPLIWSTF